MGEDRSMTKSVDDIKARTAKAMMEKELQENVRKLALARGYRYYHTHRSEHSPSGFPDCVLIRNNASGGRLIFAELKREGKDPTPDQQAWLDDLDQLDNEAYVWHPSDWLSGEIDRILT
jgi:hypothetical protein